MNSFLSDGYKVEQVFANLLSKYGSVEYSDSETDINEHWDVALTLKNSRKVKFDVKGLRKLNRTDSDYNENIQWIEFVNVNGDKGWLYGNADCIAFEKKLYFVLMRRSDIIKFLTEHPIAKYKMFSNTKKPYMLYRRYNRKDIIMQVNIDEFNCKKLFLKKIKT